MRPYELPLIEESSPVEEQLQQIKSFLYRQAENLNYNLKNSDVVSLWRQTAEALSVSSNEEVEEMRRDEFQALRGLIIKSATSIVKNEDSFSAHFSGDYTAESDFGSFTEEGNIYINGNPYTIGQIYKYQAQIVTDVSKYKTDMEGFIKSGVLERETSNPVFGMEIGYNKSTYTVDGKVYQNNSPAKIRITPVKIGFYQGDYEVAYLQNSAIYFPAAHITGGSIKIGDNFSVDNQGNMKALNAEIQGTVIAGAGFIGGFQIRGSSQTEGDFWPCSFSSILTPKDDDYQYAVFMRGFYNENGTIFGAKDKTHVAFGVKSILKTAKDWSDPKDYLWYVDVQGHTYTTQLRAKEIATDYFTGNADKVIIGKESDYAKPIEFYTSDEIRIGTYKNKASNIYLLASGTVRIGQHSAASASGGTDYPPTANVQIQASSLFQVGSSGYAVAEAKVYATKAYVYADSTQFSGVIAPTSNEGANLGHPDYKWKYIYSKYLSVSSSGCYIGGDSYEAPINIKTSGNLTLGGLVGNKYEEHTFSEIITYMRESRSLIVKNESDIKTTNTDLTDVIKQMNSNFTTFTNAINNNIVEINKIKVHLGIS